MAEAGRFSFEEYIALEGTSLEKHEFYEGHILAMSGGTPLHAWLGAAISAALWSGRRPGPCTMFGSDLRIRVSATGLCTYPDISIVCGPLARDPADRNTVTNPTVLVEVLSPSTERYDRTEKFEHYQKIATLQDYVLVSSRRPRVEVYHRQGDGSWRYTTAGPGEQVRIDSVGATLSVDEIYEGAPEEDPEDTPTTRLG